MDKQILQQHIDNNLSQREIAKEEGVSQSTVRYWLYTHELRTNTGHGEPGDKYKNSLCKTHGDTQHILENRGSYRCVKCRSERITKARRNLKIDLVNEAGGKCISCGYNKSIVALQFDHRDPATKSHEIALLVRNRRRKDAFEEMKKCDLLCANCHAEKTERSYYEV